MHRSSQRNNLAGDGSQSSCHSRWPSGSGQNSALIPAGNNHPLDISAHDGTESDHMAHGRNMTDRCARGPTVPIHHVQVWNLTEIITWITTPQRAHHFSKAR